MTVEHLVIDASALIDLVRARGAGPGVRERVEGRRLHAPAHLDAEVLSGLGRLHRAGEVSAEAVEAQLAAVARAPITKHEISPLLAGSWARRHEIRMADALYVELADRLGLRLLTTDERLARATRIAEAVVIPDT